MEPEPSGEPTASERQAARSRGTTRRHRDAEQSDQQQPTRRNRASVSGTAGDGDVRRKPALSTSEIQARGARS
ncbi:hypothetical protein ACWEOH_02410 [Agromyces sp. NPDC004153]